MNTFLAGLTIFTALTVKSIELPAIFEALDSQDFLNFLTILLSISAMIFLLFIGLQAFIAVIWANLMTWAAKTINTGSNETELRYLVHDLLLLYQPKRLETQSESQSIAVLPD